MFDLNKRLINFFLKNYYEINVQVLEEGLGNLTNGCGEWIKGIDLARSSTILISKLIAWPNSGTIIIQYSSLIFLSLACDQKIQVGEFQIKSLA